MSKTFVYDRFDMIAGDGPGVYPEPSADGDWLKAEDAINREAVLNARIRTLEAQLKDARAELEAERQPWIPVGAGLPEIRALAFTPSDNPVMQHRIIPGGLFRQVAKEATHWMPLPSNPPRKETGK